MSKQLTYGKAILRLAALALGVAFLALILFYSIYYADCESGGYTYTLEEALYAAIDYAGMQDGVSEEDMMAYLAGLGWPEERFESTIDRISEGDPELMLRLFAELEEYCQGRYGCSMEELVW